MLCIPNISACDGRQPFCFSNVSAPLIENATLANYSRRDYLPANRDSNGQLPGSLTNGHAPGEGRPSGKLAGRGRRRGDEETAGLLAEERTAGQASTSSREELEVRPVGSAALVVVRLYSDPSRLDRRRTSLCSITTATGVASAKRRRGSDSVGNRLRFANAGEILLVRRLRSLRSILVDALVHTAIVATVVHTSAEIPKGLSAATCSSMVALTRCQSLHEQRGVIGKARSAGLARKLSFLRKQCSPDGCARFDLPRSTLSATVAPPAEYS